MEKVNCYFVIAENGANTISQYHRIIALRMLCSQRTTHTGNDYVF